MGKEDIAKKWEPNIHRDNFVFRESLQIFTITGISHSVSNEKSTSKAYVKHTANIFQRSFAVTTKSCTL